MKTEEKYAVHVIEMLRNNGTVSRELKEGGNGDAVFFMFDYFDILIYKKLQDAAKDYVHYLTIENVFDNENHYKVAYKTLSLYQHKQADRINPFVMKNVDGISQSPFLGVIQISLCKECYMDFDLKRMGGEVDTFLRNYEEQILSVVESSLRGEGLTYYQLYRSSTTGDFCLAIRTDSVDAIYRTALSLNSNRSEGGLHVITYTNLGMECKLDQNGNYYTLSDGFVKQHQNICFALRLSADKKFEEILVRYKSTDKTTIGEESWKAMGLFGRYDYLLNISLAEFAEIYPSLCKRKMQPGTQGCDFDKNKTDLRNILNYPELNNINERVLVGLEKICEEVGRKNDSKDFDKKYCEYIINKNQFLYQRIKNIDDKYRKEFSLEDRAFRDLHRGMKELYKTYSAIGMEKEAYTNWMILHNDMNLLCRHLEDEIEYCRKVSKEDESMGKDYRIKLLRAWRTSLQAINQYSRLVQNINYQTYQSPVYEIQTQIDTEKAMVAYREAMETYIQLFTNWNRDKKESVSAMIFPDITQEMVRVIAPYWEMDKNFIIFIICTVPSFEYFGRLYDLLPLLMHECSHQVRILTRKQRNQFVTKYILGNVLKVAMKEVILSIAEEIPYDQFSKAENNFIDCVVQTAERWVFRQKEFNNYNYEQLVTELEKYILKLCRDDNNFQMLERDEKTRKKVLEFLLGECRRKALLSSTGSSNKILGKYFEELNRGGREGREALQFIARRLLRVYRRNLRYYCSSYKMPLDNSPQKFACLKDMESSICCIQDKLQNLNKELVGDKQGTSKRYIEIAVKEYAYDVIQLHRIYNQYNECLSGEGSDAKRFWTEVFINYRNCCRNEDWVLNDLVVAQLKQRMGVLSNSEKRFTQFMIEKMGNVSFEMLRKTKLYYSGIYREVCADLLMAATLNLTSFGYCRQVLQTISDVQIEEEQFLYESENYERFRIVTAVLLAEEGVEVTNETNSEYSLNAATVINLAKMYCGYAVQSIQKRIVEKLDEKDAKLREIKGMVQTFGDLVKEQVLCAFGEMEGVYQETLLYLIVHGNRGDINDDIMDIWNAYTPIHKYLNKYRYQFWRLECLCRGLETIIQEGKVFVARDIFEHAKTIKSKVSEKGQFSCKWEKGVSDCFVHPKLDVGNFYNDPKSVCEVGNIHKLETMIEFIQNYYYHNRFRMIQEGGKEQTDERYEKGSCCQVCGELGGSL